MAGPARRSGYLFIHLHLCQRHRFSKAISGARPQRGEAIGGYLVPRVALWVSTVKEAFT